MQKTRFPQRPLNKHLAIDSAADPQDVLETKLYLHRKGLYETHDYGITPYPDEAMFHAIKKYQNYKGLNVDGVIKIDGETQESMKKDEIEREELPPLDYKAPTIPGTNIPDRSIPESGLPYGIRDPNGPDYEQNKETDPNMIRKPAKNFVSKMPEWAQIPRPSDRYPRGGRY